MNRFLISLLGLVLLAQTAQAELRFGIDFSEAPEGPAKKYLHMSNFDAQQNAQDKLRPEIRGGRLILELGSGYLGGYTLGRELEGVKKLRVRWGVDSYPKGADWEDDEKREAVMVVVVFKTERVSSGSWLLPAVPRFLALFLSDSAQGGKWYQGNYYEEGGRYRCEPCNASAGEEVVSELDLEAAYQENYGEPMPPVLGFGLEFDTRGIDGDSKAFVRSIELLSE